MARFPLWLLVALVTLAFATPSHAAIKPGKAKLGSSSTSQSLNTLTPPGGRHATAASWHEGSMVQEGTINCVTGFVEVLGGSYVGWFGEVGVSPVVNQTYYIKVGWGISGNPCTGGAYVHTEIQLPSFTSLAVTATNKVRCFYKSPTKTTYAESPNGCPQAPTSVGLYGGLSFDPVGATAWPSAFGSLFEIWIPVKTTQPLSGLITGGSTGCPSCLFAGTWMIDGWNSPWVFPVQGVMVNAAPGPPPPTPTPYVDYPTPNHFENPVGSGTWWTSGYVFTEGTSGNLWIEMRQGTSGPFSAAPPQNPGVGSWRLDQSWTGLTPGATYQFHICYDQNGPFTLPVAFCGPDQSFVLPGGTDSLAPNTSIEAKPPARTNSRTATFSFDSTELGSTFFCKLDGAAFAPCSAPTYTGLAGASHTLQVRARDIAGNDDLSPASYTWIVDLTKPNTRITLGPKASTTSRTAKFKFTSTEAGSKFQCKLDAKPWAACSSPKTYSSLKKGRHTLRVRATDKAGNVDASPASKTWRIT
jgi:hypothetical protein